MNYSKSLLIGNTLMGLLRPHSLVVLSIFLLSVTSVLSAPAPFFSCTDFHCEHGQAVLFSEQQWLDIRKIFSVIDNPDQERDAIRKAIGLIETEVGEITGTDLDLAENLWGKESHGQLDCISESRNTTTYLQLLYDDRLLRWHKVKDRKHRAPWIFNVHWTAVIQDLKTHTEYAVDSWFKPNGQPPVIQELDSWIKGEKLD
jgi:hypothetical protein